jgi:hypothetical protein
VLPERFAINHIDIVYRADGCTGAAGGACIICDEVTIVRYGSAG